MRTAAAIFLCLALAASAQDETTEALAKHARTYAKDATPAAKAALLKAGPAAIRVLIEERAAQGAEGFDRLSDLACTLRFKADEDSRARYGRDRLAQLEIPIEGGWEVTLRDLANEAISMISRQHDDGDEGSGATFTIDPHPRMRVPIYIDPAVCPAPDTIILRYPAGYVPGKVYLELDRALALHGLDWTIRYGVLLISTPGRLWPSPGRRPALTDAQRARLKQLVDDLDAADLETRDRAGRELLTLGPEAVAPLEALKGSEDATGRAREIAARIRSVHADYAYGFRAALDEQKLDGEDLKVAEIINDTTKYLSGHGVIMTNTRLDAAVSSLGREAGVIIDVVDEIADLKVTIDADGIRLRDALMLVTRTHGLDFEVRNGRVVVTVPKTK